VEQLGYVEGPKDGSYFLRYWDDPDATGKRVRRAIEVGTKRQFQSREEANLSVEAALLRRQINAGLVGKTVGQVIANYEQTELPKRASTRATTMAALAHIRERWENEGVTVLALSTSKPLIEGWLNHLKSRRGNHYGKPSGTQLSASARSGIKQQLIYLVEFAMQQGYISGGFNEIRKVKIFPGEPPVVKQPLTMEQMELFLTNPKFPEHVKVMGQVAKYTGFRISEIVGLKRDDFDLDNQQITVSRAVVKGVVDKPKSPRSGDPVPLHPELVKILVAWFKSKAYGRNFAGWVFPNPLTGQPYQPRGMYKKYITPFGRQHDIAGFGWHSFRHSYKQYLDDSGAQDSEIMRLMRHSRYATSLLYGTGKKLSRLQSVQATAIEAMNTPTPKRKKVQWG
jgi:integrase